MKTKTLYLSLFLTLTGCPPESPALRDLEKACPVQEYPDDGDGSAHYQALFEEGSDCAAAVDRHLEAAREELEHHYRLKESEKPDGKRRYVGCNAAVLTERNRGVEKIATIKCTWIGVPRSE